MALTREQQDTINQMKAEIEVIKSQQDARRKIKEEECADLQTRMYACQVNYDQEIADMELKIRFRQERIDEISSYVVIE